MKRTPIHMKRLAGEESCFRSAEKGNQFRDLFRAAAPAEQRRAMRVVSRLAHRGMAARRANQSGHHAVHGDLVGREVVGKASCETDQPRFCRYDVRAPGRPGMRRHTAYIDDCCGI